MMVSNVEITVVSNMTCVVATLWLQKCLNSHSFQFNV